MVCWFIIQTMEGSKQQISSSSLFRFKQAGREAELGSFLQFKQEFQNYFPPQRVEQIKRVYQHGVCGRSQHRHTVVVDRVGNIKMQELAKVFEEDELAAYLSQRLIRLSERLEEKEQLVWIVDLSGKIMQLASKKILDALSKIILNLQRFFPNILHKLVFVNTPMLFDTIWTKITPLISPHTLDKVVMIGDEVENLYEFAEQSVLPDFLGGDIPEEDFLNDRQGVGSPQKEEEESSSEEEIDFSSLKQALSGLKVGGSSLQSVSQTPLNTEADDK